MAKNFVLLKVFTADLEEPQKPNGLFTVLGFEKMEHAKELVMKLKQSM